MPSNLSTFDSAMKENYGPGLKNGINKSHPLLTEVEPDFDHISGDGRDVVWAMRSGRSSSTGNRAEGAALPVAGNQGFTKLVDTVVSAYHTIKVTGQNRVLSQGKDGAFLKAVEAEVEGGEEDIKNDTHRQLYGTKLTDGTIIKSGVVGVLSADPGTSTTWTFAASSRAEMRYFFVGMKFVVINHSDGSLRSGGAYTVTAVNLGATTVTTTESADTGIASGDYVVRGDASANSWGNEVNGLRHLISTQKNAGIDPATVPSWGAMAAGSSTTAISEVIFEEADEMVQTEGNGSSPDLWLCENSQRRKLASQLQAQKRYDGMQKTLESGWKGLDIAQGTLIADRYCPTTSVFGITTKDLARFVGEDWHWDETDGHTLWRALDGTDAVEGRFQAYHQYGALVRNSHVLLTLSVPVF